MRKPDDPDLRIYAARRLYYSTDSQENASKITGQIPRFLPAAQLRQPGKGPPHLIAGGISLWNTEKVPYYWSPMVW